MRIALVDGDELVYKVALRYEQKIYRVMHGCKTLWTCPFKEDAVESIGDIEGLEINPFFEVYSLDGFIDEINKNISRILFNTKCTDIRYYLSGKHNFRYSFAKLLPYKGNRESSKPFHFEEVRNELLSRGAEVVDFLEADDLLVINHRKIKSKGVEGVICSSDKDLRNESGMNYNIGKKLFQFISPRDARYNFYYQLLIGDSVDNIPSPYGLGEMAAKAILAKLYDEDASDFDYYQQVKKHYTKWINTRAKDGSYKTRWYTGQNIDDILWEVGNLLYMHTTLDPNERWERPIEGTKEAN
jgi:hypothetical protein